MHNLEMERGKGFFGRGQRSSEAERRRTLARTHFELEVECRRQGWGADPALVYDEEHGLFRFTDDRFAFS